MMKRPACLGLIILLFTVLVFTACKGASGSNEPAAEKTTEERAESMTSVKESETGDFSSEESLTEEPVTEEPAAEAPKNLLEVIFAESEEKGVIAKILTQKINQYGKPWFTNDNISKVMGTGLVYLLDMDDDGKDELFLIHWEKGDPYGKYVMEIYGGSKGDLIYSGPPYYMGADNAGLYILKDASGQKILVYDNEDSMNGRFLGVINRGKLEVIHEMDWENDTCEFPEDAFVLNGERYDEVAQFGMYCYNYQEINDDYLAWKDTFKNLYRDSLISLGLSKEVGAAYYTPGITSLLDNKYLLIKETQVDASGTVDTVYEHEYNSDGKEIRTYRNDMLYREKEYNEAGILIHEIQYGSKTGYKYKEDIYDDNGNLTEAITYSENGNINWDIVSTYDENGNKLTEDSGIAYKEYVYNEDGVLIEVTSRPGIDREIEVWHEYTLDDEGRQVLDTIIKKGVPLKCTTWEYYEDGSYQETSWYYQRYNENVDMVLLEGKEVPSTITWYNKDGKETRTEVWSFEDYGSDNLWLTTSVDNEYDSDGNLIKTETRQFNKDVLSYEEIITYERNSDGKVVIQENHYHNYGYWTNLGEEERELSYTAYEYDFNEKGYKVHGIARGNDDPYSGKETYVKYENYLLYQNAFGDLMGIDY